MKYLKFWIRIESKIIKSYIGLISISLHFLGTLKSPNTGLRIKGEENKKKVYGFGTLILIIK